MKAMLFAAGLGSRLKPFTDQHPKALAEVGGKTLLELSLRYLRRHGIAEVIVNVHHFAGQIVDALHQNQGFGSSVTISDESAEVLETGGGLKKATPFFEGEERFLVMNVDVLTSLDLNKLIAAHHTASAAGKNPLATLAVMRRPSSRNLLFDEQMQLCGWRNTQTGAERMARPCEGAAGLAFSGIQVVSGGLLKSIRHEGRFSMIDLYLEAAATGLILGYDHSGDVFIDVGKPETLALAQQLLPQLTS